MPDLSAADELLAGGVASGVYSAAAYAVAHGGEIAGVGGFGKLSFEPDAPRATAQTVFDIASLTKPVATATAILQLVERGVVTLVDPVSSYFEGDFGPLPHMQPIEIRHLLAHTSGLPPIPEMPAQIAKTPDERTRLLAAVLATRPLRPPGEGYTYSDTGYILLGEVVGRVSGRPLGDWFREEIAGPLHLYHTGFRPGSRRDIAVTEPALTPRAVHDPRARALGGVAGHAGLFSTVEDMLAYAEAIRTGGAPILCRGSQQRMATSQIPADKGGQSYGWFCHGNDYLPAGDLFSERSYGHSGFTGCALLIDPEFAVSLVLLTNRVLNSSEDGVRFLKLRRRWLNCVAGAVTRR